MIEQLQVHRPAWIADLWGDFFICLAGIQITGGVIVTEYHGAGQAVQGMFQDDADVNHRSRDASLADPDIIYYPVGTVQQKDPEFLMCQVAQYGLEKQKYILAASNPYFIL